MMGGCILSTISVKFFCFISTVHNLGDVDSGARLYVHVVSILLVDF